MSNDFSSCLKPCETVPSNVYREETSGKNFEPIRQLPNGFISDAGHKHAQQLSSMNSSSTTPVIPDARPLPHRDDESIVGKSPKRKLVSDVAAQVESFLASDVVKSMAPLDHFNWAGTLPSLASANHVPARLQKVISESQQLPPQQLHETRVQALMKWAARKEVLHARWVEKYEQLPLHVQSVLGKGKNLLLGGEMMTAAGSPDQTLVNHLANGFPLVGKLPRSGTLSAHPYTRWKKPRTA